MAAWMWPAAGAAASLGASLLGGSTKVKSQIPEYIREAQHRLISPGMGGVWSLPEVGYGPHRVHTGPDPMVTAAYMNLAGRAAPSPYEAAAGQYANRAIQGGYLNQNPAMPMLGAYGAGYGGIDPMGGPGRALMTQTAAGGGYNNPYLQRLVSQAQRQTGANVASMFGGGGMGGSSLETQLAAREMGDIASRMYGGAYEAERSRQTGMQQALGALETGRLGLGLQQRGQNIGAATTLGQLFGQERGLQQEAAFNVPGLTSNDLARLQAGIGAATGLEGYGLRQREEQRQAWLADQMAPYNRLGFIGSTIAGQPYSTTQTTSGPYQNPLTAALGGGLVGYGLWRESQRQPTTYSTGAGGPYNPWAFGSYTPGVPR